MSRVALVTGGARGIGLGISSRLAEEGISLCICGRKPAEEVFETVQTLEESGIKALYVSADVSSAGDRLHLVNSIIRHFGRLDILVNNAGIAPPERKDILDASEKSFEKVMKVNLQGPYFLTQIVANYMSEQRKASPEFKGCIVNISSVSADFASVSRGEYCISKAGIAMATRLWAARLAEFGISVYEVRPGLIKTDMTEGVTDKYDKLIEEGLTLQKRWGFPEDVGKAVASLARGDFPYSTGSVFMVDGGMSVNRL